MESNQNKPKPKIIPTANGPFILIDNTSHPVGNLQNSKGEPYLRVSQNALCRCGGSKNKPFCDGRHWYIKFKAEG